MLGLLVGCAVWVALGGAAWAKPKPVLILPYQSTEADTWLGEAIAETLYVASQGTPALLPIDRSRAMQAAKGPAEDGRTAGACATGGVAGGASTTGSFGVCSVRRCFALRSSSSLKSLSVRR